MNRALLPVVCEQLSVATKREVNVEEITWIQPLGLLGITPLITAGPIEIGQQVQGEQSSVYVEEVKVGIRFLQVSTSLSPLSPSLSFPPLPLAFSP